MKDLQVYVHTHRPFPFQPSRWLKLVTHERAPDLPGAWKIPDQMPGVKLRSLNSVLRLAEEEAEVLGCWGYRRYALFHNQHRCPHHKLHMEPSGENLDFLGSEMQAEAIHKILKSHDIIQYRPFVLDMNMREQYAHFSPPEVWDIMVEEIKAVGMGESLGYFEANNQHVWCALSFAKRQVFCDLVAFIRDFIARMQRREDFRPFWESGSVSSNGTRHCMHEVYYEYLVPFWVFHNRLKSAHVPMVILEKGI